MMTCCDVRGGSGDVGVGAWMDLEVEGTVGRGREHEGQCIIIWRWVVGRGLFKKRVFEFRSVLLSRAVMRDSWLERREVIGSGGVEVSG